MRKIFDHVELGKIDISGLDRKVYIPRSTQLPRIAELYVAANERRWAPTTRHLTVIHLRHWVRSMGQIEVADIVQAHVERHVAARRRAGMAMFTILQEISTLRNLLEWCLRRGIVSHNFMRAVRAGRDLGIITPAQCHRSVRTLMRHHLGVLHDRIYAQPRR